MIALIQTVASKLRLMPVVAGAMLASSFTMAGAADSAAQPTPSTAAKPYAGVPYHDSVYNGGAQVIPGKLQNEYYDTLEVTDAEKAAGAGENVTYHDTDNKNSGSGALNGRGSYLKEFRISESPDTSFVKLDHAGVAIDDSPFNLAPPDKEALYLGWIAPGEWVKYTVEVKEAGVYTLNVMYTSKFAGHISIDSDGVDVSGPLAIPTTFNAEDTIEWRQAHHWNKVNGLGKLTLKKGVQVLTLHFIDKPVMNFDYMEFVKID